MTNQSETQTAHATPSSLLVYREGAIGGLIGSVGIAAWFLLADILQGRPFFTPSVLGATVLTVLRGGGLTSPDLIPISFGTVMMFSVLHGTTFAIVGACIARLIREAGRSEGYRLAVNVLLVFFVAWFIFMNMIVAGVVMGALQITDILIANLVAVAAMAFYFRASYPAPA
jgi:hypothetical protein